MKKKDSRQLSAKEIFLLAVGLNSASERDAILNEHCKADFDLKKQVSRLIIAADRDNGESPLDVIVDAFGPEETLFKPELDGGSQPAAPWVPKKTERRQIGPYKLLEQIGQGGFGTVYMAEQTSPVRRKVALKILKPGMDSGEVIARFEAERQALAMMEHPNIAKILDAGTGDDGRPYFAMELVHGIPVTDYCDEARLTTDERLRLFIDICRAVHHAHQKGIIHRDLKPSNVLVTMHDDKAVPKVIDFGIAKALSQQLTDRTLFTGYQQMLGTPLYMSPEQAQMSGIDIDTRSDVYSLGVLLYELLTGTTPFSKETLSKASLDDLRRIIREEQPPRPSHRITTIPKAELSTTANKRGLDDRAFTKSVHSELDWITLKSLEKDRSRRYDSAAAFGDDIQRYLNNESVLACPPSLAYQLRKLIRRNRVAVLISGATMLSLLIGLSLTAWQWKLAVAAKQDTANALQLVAQKADLANKRLGVAEQAIDEMYTQFAQDWLSQQSKLTDIQREYLEKAVAAFEQLAALDPTDTKPRIGAIIAKYRSGSILQQLGRIDEAIANLEQSVEMCNIALGFSLSDTDLRIRRAEANVGLSSIYRNKGNQSEALKYADAAFAELNEVERSEQLSEPQRDLLSKGFSNCALRFLSDRTRKSEARKSADSGVAIARQLWHDKPMDLAIKERLAQSLSAKGNQCLWWGEQNEECAAAYQESIELKLQLVVERPDRHDVLKSLPGSMQNFAIVLRRLKREEESDAIIRKNVEIVKKLVSRFPDVASYKSQFGEGLRSVGNLELRRENFDKAKDYWTQSRDVLSEVVDQFPDVRGARKSLVSALLNLGLQHLSHGDYQLAVETYESANSYLVQFAKTFPTDTEMFIFHRTVLRQLAIGYLQLGAHEKASVVGQQLVGLVGLPVNSDSYYPSRFSQNRNDLMLFIEVNRINTYCSDLINAERPDAKQTANESIAPDYALNAQEHLDRAKKLVSTWLQSQESSGDFWSALLSWIDESKNWQNFGRSPSMDKLFNDAVLQSHVLLLNAFVDKFVDAKPLPDNWPSVMLAMASAKEFSLSPERQLAICKRGLQQAHDAPLVSQAYAWTLFRNARWQQCEEMLRTEPKLNSDENGFILAMALWHLGQKERAHETFDKTSAWMAANMEQLETRRKAKPFVEQPNSETLARLKQEAEQIIKPNGTH